MDLLDEDCRRRFASRGYGRVRFILSHVTKEILSPGPTWKRAAQEWGLLAQFALDGKHRRDFVGER